MLDEFDLLEIADRNRREGEEKKKMFFSFHTKCSMSIQKVRDKCEPQLTAVAEHVPLQHAFAVGGRHSLWSPKPCEFGF